MLAYSFISSDNKSVATSALCFMTSVTVSESKYLSATAFNKAGNTFLVITAPFFNNDLKAASSFPLISVFNSDNMGTIGLLSKSFSQALK